MTWRRITSSVLINSWKDPSIFHVGVFTDTAANICWGNPYSITQCSSWKTTNKSQILWHLKSSFHTLLQTGMRCKERSVDVFLKGLYEGFYEPSFWQTSNVWRWCSTQKKSGKHLCGFCTNHAEYLLPALSREHLLLSFPGGSYSDISYEYFPVNSFNPHVNCFTSPGSNYLAHTFSISYLVFSSLQWMYSAIKFVQGWK